MVGHNREHDGPDMLEGGGLPGRPVTVCGTGGVTAVAVAADTVGECGNPRAR